jgi:hypothetical protein
MMFRMAMAQNLHPLRSGEAPWEERTTKNLSRDILVCTCLQALEIPQNRQRNLWKSLAKKGLVLEIPGKKAWKRDATEGLGTDHQRVVALVEDLLDRRGHALGALG